MPDGEASTRNSRDNDDGSPGRDQLEHYASRKAQSVDQTARWLAEHLEDEKEPMTSQG